jgi:ABC-type phosphate transport system ATPase subunit
MNFSEKTINAYKELQNAYRSINMDEVTILTGSNGSGKSLIRKQIPFLMANFLNLDHHSKTKGMVLSTSMEARTTSRPEWGGLSSVLHDTSWIATSQNTYSSIKKLFNSIKSDSKSKYLIIDEFEIGCGEETVLALTNYINENISQLRAEGKIMGALIITHSRIGVNNLIYDSFVNIQGLTKEQWLDRKIEPIDLDELDNNELFFYIRDKDKS